MPEPQPSATFRWTVGTANHPVAYGPFLTFGDAQKLQQRKAVDCLIYKAVTTYEPVTE